MYSGSCQFLNVQFYFKASTFLLANHHQKTIYIFLSNNSAARFFILAGVTSSM